MSNYSSRKYNICKYMDFTKIKILKELGVGMVATAYLIEYEGKQYVMKKQKILERDKNRDSRSVTWREIFFLNM